MEPEKKLSSSEEISATVSEQELNVVNFQEAGNTNVTTLPTFHYSGNLLRNFTTTFLDELISRFDYWKNPKEYHALKRKEFYQTSFITVSNIIEDMLKNGFDDTELDSKLFNELAWILPDTHFIYRFDSDKTQSEIVDIINKKTHSLNKSIISRNILSHPDSLQLVSLRQEGTSVILLLRNGYTKDEEEKKTVFFITCELDFDKKNFILKIRETHRKNKKISQRALLQYVLKYINDIVVDISIIAKSDKVIKEKIYELFKEETERAEKIITTKLPIPLPKLEKNISDFVINNLNLKDTDSLSANCNIIKSMYYQNIAKEIDSKVFQDRYIFAFLFFDCTTTRSITRDAKRNHIYAKDLYWSLKSIVNKETKVDEISIYYKINNKDYRLPAVGDNFIGLEVTIKEFCGSFMIDYYRNNNRTRDPKRRMKSEFIIHELRKYL